MQKKAVPGIFFTPQLRDTELLWEQYQVLPFKVDLALKILTIYQG